MKTVANMTMQPGRVAYRSTFHHLVAVILLLLLQSVPIRGELPAPTITGIEGTSSTSIQLTWTPVTDTNVTGYNIYYGPMGKAFKTTYVPGRETSVETISGLDEYTIYVVWMTSKDATGTESARSDSGMVQTHEDAPSAAPQNVFVSDVTASTATLTWEEVQEQHQNGIIQGYRITYKIDGADVSESYQVDETTLEYTATGLLSDTLYMFSVLAFTSVGDGPGSDAVSERTLVITTTPVPSTSTIDPTTAIISTTMTTRILTTHQTTKLSATDANSAPNIKDPEEDQVYSTPQIAVIAVSVFVGTLAVSATIILIVYKCHVATAVKVAPSPEPMI